MVIVAYSAYSVDLYSRIGEETGVPVDFRKTGTLRLATNETRLNEFKRYVARDYWVFVFGLRCFQVEGDVCKTTLVSKDQVKELAPLLDDSSVVGALYTTGDGHIEAKQLTRALVKVFTIRL